MLLSRSIVPAAEALTELLPKLEVVLSSTEPLRVKDAEGASCLTRSMRTSLLDRPIAETISAFLPLAMVFTAWLKKLVDIRLFAER